jgi:hypothetical protein
MDQSIIERAMSLPMPLEMHDSQIVATVLIRSDLGNDVRLMTCDGTIIGSGLVPIVW